MNARHNMAPVLAAHAALAKARAECFGERAVVFASLLRACFGQDEALRFCRHLIGEPVFPSPADYIDVSLCLAYSLLEAHAGGVDVCAALCSERRNRRDEFRAFFARTRADEQKHDPHCECMGCASGTTRGAP